jgi:drug/metabolite transporter (DMT)-like permease
MTAVVWGALAALSWGTGDFLSRFTSRAIGVKSMLFWALLIGSLISGVYAYNTGHLVIPDAYPLSMLALSGSVNMLGLMALFYGIARGPISVVAPIVSAHPVFVALLGLALGVYPDAVQWAFMLVTMVGILLLARIEKPEEELGDRMGGLDGAVVDRDYVNLSMKVAFMAAVCFTIQVTAAQEATQIVGSTTATFYNRTFGMLSLLVLFLFRREGIKRPSSILIFFLVLANGMLEVSGTFSLLSGSEGVGRAIATVVSACFAPVTVIMASVFLKEKVSLAQWACIAIIVAGVMGLTYLE